MSNELQRQERNCLNFTLAYEMAEYACSLINRAFTPERLTRIAIVFDESVRAGEFGDRSMIAAITREMEQYGDPNAKPKSRGSRLFTAVTNPPKAQELFGLAPLPRNEETALLALVEAEGLPVSALACRMTRQTGEGYTNANRRPDIEWKLGDGQVVIVKVVPRRTRFRISYDLELCEYCGNIEPGDHCPAKLRALRERLLEQMDEEPLTRLTD